MGFLSTRAPAFWIDSAIKKRKVYHGWRGWEIESMS